MGNRFDLTTAGAALAIGFLTHNVGSWWGYAFWGSPFHVSPAFVGFARRQAGGFWDDHYGCRDRITRAGGFFPRWALIWTPGNCDSALIASTGIVTAWIRELVLIFQSRDLFVICKMMPQTNRKWYSGSPPRVVPKTIPSRDVFLDLIRIVQRENKLQWAGAHMILENSTMSNGEGRRAL